jgi:hypothetical protein
MLGKIIIIILLLCSNAYAGLLKLPTQEQLDKHCIAVRLNIDNDIHYFAVRTIVKFDDTGFTVKFGKRGEGRNFIPKENILNWEECRKSYEEKR